MRKMEDQDTMDKKISCAIFDVDGTLLDSMGVWINIGDIYLRKKGYEPDPELAEKVKVMTVPLTAAYGVDARPAAGAFGRWLRALRELTEAFFRL